MEAIALGGIYHQGNAFVSRHIDPAPSPTRKHIRTFYSPRAPSHHRTLLPLPLAHWVPSCPWVAFKSLRPRNRSSLRLPSCTHLGCSYLGHFQQRQQTSASHTMLFAGSIILFGLLASLTPVRAQTFTDCNPTQSECLLLPPHFPPPRPTLTFVQGNAPPKQDSPPHPTLSTSSKARIPPTGSTPAPVRSTSPNPGQRLRS